MRVINPGILNSEGITITCRACGCQYMVEDRNDWDIGKSCIDIYPRRYTAEYYVVCPECGYLRYFGVDPNVAQNGSLKEHASIFDRPDWKRRYEVKFDEENDKKQSI